MSKFGLDPVPGMDGTAEPSPGTTAVAIRPVGLRIVNGPRTGLLLTFDRPVTVVGRNDPPDIVVDLDLSDAELGSPPITSRRHAQVHYDPNTGELFLTDTGSTNGTWVDGERLIPNVRSKPLVVPVRVRLGNLDFETTYADE